MNEKTLSLNDLKQCCQDFDLISLLPKEQWIKKVGDEKARIGEVDAKSC